MLLNYRNFHCLKEKLSSKKVLCFCFRLIARKKVDYKSQNFASLKEFLHDFLDMPRHGDPIPLIIYYAIDCIASKRFVILLTSS